jgi:hypothetical protein
MLNRVQRNTVLLGYVLAGATLATAGPGYGQSPEGLARARLDIARKAYQHVEDSIMAPAADVGKLPSRVWTALNLEQLVGWSRRWMEAERDASGSKTVQVAALEAHRKRLKKWEDTYSELARGESSGEWSHAVDLLTFHRLEAEYWLAKAKDER